MSDIEKTEKVEMGKEGNFTQNLSDFIQRKRIVFLIGFIALVVAIAASVTVISVRSSLNSKALSQVETLNRRYEALRFDITETSKEADVNALLDDLKQLAEAQKGYASARAYFISASIHSDKKNWGESAALWDKTALASKGTYLEPVAFYNEAIALEEQNNAQGAIDLFSKAASISDFPGAPRAQFNIGRLQEGLNKELAIEAYNKLLSQWPNEDIWASLAQSRVIALNISKN